MTETDFVPIEPNPYIVGNPVRNPKMFFGREAEFQTVRHHFVESSDGMVFVFCGERRSGKTSILFQIRDGRLGPEFLPVLIDMQAMVIESESDFFTLITDVILTTLGETSKTLNPPNYDVAKPSAVFQKFIANLRSLFPDRKLVLLIDEYELMEDKVRDGQLSEDVFHMFSHLMENGRVFFIFTGSQHLDQRGNQVWRILAKSHHKRISYLDKADAIDLIEGPVQGRVRFGEGAVDEVFRLGAGQPFYTQWVCQNLVDHLNEQRTLTADAATLASAMRVLVNNPPPEMTRLWGDLERDEKLMLALLAEVLNDEGDFTTPEKLASFAARTYRIDDTDLPRIARAAAELLKQEFLTRNPDDPKAGFAFRMDLWRLWVRHSHSVWQVIHEEDFQVRPKRVWAPILGVLVVLPVLWAVYEYLPRPEPVPPPPVPPPTRLASIRLEVEPQRAQIFLGGRHRGTGILEAHDLEPGDPHEIRLTAAGYYDSTLTFQFLPDEEKFIAVSLRAQIGSLHVRSAPSGGNVRLNGQAQGKTPLTIKQLSVNTVLELEVSHRGYQLQSRRVQVVADSTVTEMFDLAQRLFDVMVSTTPTGARLSVDGRILPEPSPTTVPMAEDRHRIIARLDGYAPTDSLVEISGDSHLVFQMTALPPGTLVVQGTRPASIYFDGVLIIENVWNSQPRELTAGFYEVRAEFSNGESVVKTVDVLSGQLTRFDFTKDTITYEAP